MMPSMASACVICRDQTGSVFSDVSARPRHYVSHSQDSRTFAVFVDSIKSSFFQSLEDRPPDSGKARPIVEGGLQMPCVVFVVSLTKLLFSKAWRIPHWR